MSLQRTLVLVKPDGVQRGLLGEVLQRIEQRGLKLVGLKFLWMDMDLARQHYAAHVDKPFFPSLLTSITSSPIAAAAFEGVNAVTTARDVMGHTNPSDAAAGTLRGDFGLSIERNLVHGSDSPEAAERELALFFAPAELISWQWDGERASRE